MSGFYPVLGLLAVAVCISYAEGASFSPVQKDDISSRKLQNPHLEISALTEDDYAPLKRRLYNKNDGIASTNDNQHATKIPERNYEYLKQAVVFEKLNDLESKDKDALTSKAKAISRGGGSDGEDAVEAVGVSSNKGQPHSLQARSSEYKKRYEVNSDSAIGRELASSEQDEDCDEEDENNEESATASIPTTPPSDTDGPTETDEPCETEEPTESNSSESSGTPSQSHESTQSVDNVRTTPTETTKHTKKPRNPDQSSGSFHDEDSQGVQFSDSVSEESYGRSTEIRE